MPPGFKPAMDNLEYLAQASLSVGEALAIRDHWLMICRQDGYSLRVLADAAGMSPQGVKLICDRMCPPSGG